MQWFEVGVKYYKVGEDGNEKKVSEVFLIDAVSWTESEARMIEQLKEFVKGEFVIDSMKKSKLSEVFPFDSGEWWFKVTIDMVTIDESAGKEKKIKLYYLIMADDIQEALNRMNKSLDSMIVPYVITGINVSNIVDIFPYFKNEENE